FRVGLVSAGLLPGLAARVLVGRSGCAGLALLPLFPALPPPGLKNVADVVPRLAPATIVVAAPCDRAAGELHDEGRQILVVGVPRALRQDVARPILPGAVPLHRHVVVAQPAGKV